jgi:hypothetical protein
MKFEIEKEAMQDMIAIFGKEHAINEMVSSFRAALDVAVEELEQEINNG